MADSTAPVWAPPIVKMLGDQASPNPGTYSLNPNIRSQIDTLRNMWSMKFNTPNGWATDIANLPYGRWQFGNVQAPNGAPAGWGQRPSGTAPGILGQYGGAGGAPVPSNMDDWWRARGVPTNTNGLLGPTPGGGATPATPATPPAQSLLTTTPTPSPTPAQPPPGVAPQQPAAPPINYQGLPPELVAQMGGNTPLPGTPAWWALITGGAG